MDEEYWTRRDGTKIAVGDMDVDHLRNALRMILRNRRERRVITSAKYDLEKLHFPDDCQAELNAQAYQDLANPNAFFPLLDGGVYGSPELQKKHSR